MNALARPSERSTLLDILASGDDFEQLDAVAALAKLGDERLVPIAEKMLQMHREPKAPGRGHTLTIAELVRKSLLESPNPKLRGLTSGS